MKKKLTLSLLGLLYLSGTLTNANNHITDTVKNVLFSEPVQKVSDLVNKIKTDSSQTLMTSAGLIGGTIPLYHIVTHGSLPKNALANGILTGIMVFGTYAASQAYESNSIQHLSAKIKNKETLSPYELQKAIELSCYSLKHRNKNISIELHAKKWFLESFMFDHPQLNSNETFLNAFTKAHTKDFSLGYLIGDNQTVANYVINTYPEIVKPFIHKAIKMKISIYACLFSDLVVKRYIEQYMQPKELNNIITLVSNNNLPQSTQALKKHITTAHIRTFIDNATAYDFEFHNPFKDYLLATALEKNICEQKVDLLLHNLILKNFNIFYIIEQCPLTINMVFLHNEPRKLHIEWLINQQKGSVHHIGIEVIDNIISTIPGLIPAITSLFSKECFNTSSLGRCTINNPSFFAEIIKKHLNNNNPIVVNTKIAQKLGFPELATLSKEVCKNNILILCDTTKHITGPSKTYLDTYPHRITKSFKDALKDKAFQRITHEIMALETQEAQNGYFTFAHGEPKNMHAYQYWFTKLYEIKHTVSLDNYIFTRFDNNNSIMHQIAHYGKRIRNTLIGHRLDLFMGHCLYSGRPGACAGRYYMDSKAAYGYKNSIKNIFNQFGYKHIYTTYQHELKELEKEYKKICPKGQVLLCSFSPNALKKAVYVCNPGGSKRSVTITDAAGKTFTTSDITVIAQAMKTNLTSVKQYDSLEFCFTPTADYGLHPSIAGKEIRIFTVTGADPEKMNAYKQKEQALYEKIKAAIQAQESSKPSMPAHIKQLILAKIGKPTPSIA